MTASNRTPNMNRAVIELMLEERALGDIGAKLRESRERRGMTLREVASSTKLPFRTLEAIERNDVAQLPGGIFSRSFIRSFAVEVGLDPEQAVREFITQFPDRSVASRYPAISPSAQTDDSERRRAWTVRLLIGLAVPMAAALLFVGGPARRLPPPEQVVAAAATEGEAANPAPAMSVPGAMSSESSRGDVPIDDVARPPGTVGGEAPVDALVVDLEASGPCWVSASADGVQVVRREFRTGERVRVNVRYELKLTAGDAGALVMMLNGEETRPLGVRGKVVTVRIDRANFRKYLAEP